MIQCTKNIKIDEKWKEGSIYYSTTVSVCTKFVEKERVKGALLKVCNYIKVLEVLVYFILFFSPPICVSAWEREINLLVAVHAIRNGEAKMGVAHDRRIDTWGKQARLCSLYTSLNAKADCLRPKPVLC